MLYKGVFDILIGYLYKESDLDDEQRNGILKGHYIKDV